MPDLSQIERDGVVYDIKDATARASIVKTITIEEDVVYAFIPINEFKSCTTILVMLYMAKTPEVDYTQGGYRPRIKLGSSVAWYDGVILSSSALNTAGQFITKVENDLVLKGLLYNGDEKLYLVRSDYSIQYGSYTKAATGNDYRVMPRWDTANPNFGIYAEIEDRTKYSVPAGTVITIIGK